MNYHELPEAKLIKLSIEGDGEAYRTLIELHQAHLKSSMFSSFNNLSKEDFEDCWQNASSKAYFSLKNFREDSSFKTWLFVILKNEILLFIKHKQKIAKHEFKIEDIAHNLETKSVDYDLISSFDQRLAENAATIMEKQEQTAKYTELVERALKRLQPHHSQILTMVLMENKPYKEVADELGIPIGTVMSRLFFARKNMQKFVKQYAQSDEVELPVSN